MNTYRIIENNKIIYIEAHDSNEASRICMREHGFFPMNDPEEVS